MVPLRNVRAMCMLRKWYIITGNSHIVLEQVSNEDIHNSSNSNSLFGDSIPKDINIKNLKSRLYNANSSFCFTWWCNIKTFLPIYSSNFKCNRCDNGYCCLTYRD